MKKYVSMILAILSVMSLCTVASAEPVKQGDNTTASITFTQGGLEFISEDMDILFGVQSLPYKATTYESTDAVTFSISDTRHPSGDWEVRVKRSGSFNLAPSGTENTHGFEGVLELVSGKLTYVEGTPSPSDSPEVTVMDPVTVGKFDTEVVVATSDQTRGIFKIEWNEENIMLSLSDSEAASVTTDRYEETLIWTLVANDPGDIED